MLPVPQPQDVSVIQEFFTSVASETGSLVVATLGAGIAFSFKGLIAWWKNRRAVSSKAELVPKLVERDLNVYQLLSELLIKADAGRAFVMQFHNGTYYVNSNSQMKMSSTHEVVAPGVSKQQANRQNLLVSQYTSAVNEIISKPFWVIEVEENASDEWSQMLRSSGTKFGVYAVLRDGQSIEGYIGLSFLDDLETIIENNFPNTGTEEAKQKICLLLESYAIRVGYLLRKQPE